MASTERCREENVSDINLSCAKLCVINEDSLQLVHQLHLIYENMYI